ncbi:MAG: L,D-transpeptidase family protein [Anaerolineae bacterium]|jgi:lipoprotein-anchoring transpeptidase ErfK/SrfK
MRDRVEPVHINEQIAVLMQRGLEAAQSGNRLGARRYFAAVLELDPTHKQAWLERAAVVEDPREVMAHLAQALTLDPNDKRARQMLRQARRRAGNLPPLQELALPSTAGRPAPVPGPLVAAPKSRRRQALRRLWLLVALLAVALLVALVLWTDTPRAVVAALIPSPTATSTPTPTPTYTPRPTFTPTPSATPTSTPTATATPTSTPTPTPTPTPVPTRVPADKSESDKWIEVDLSQQRLYAHEGQKTVLKAVVSTGIARYPTLPGRFKIYAKYRATRMTGPGYDLPNVPWTMFYSGNYGIHGTYWHNNFGHPMSHGCINMKTVEAKWLFKWAPKGTLVVIHR